MNNQDFRLNFSDYLYIFKYTLSYRNMPYTVTHFKYDNSRNSKHAILVIDSNFEQNHIRAALLFHLIFHRLIYNNKR